MHTVYGYNYIYEWYGTNEYQKIYSWHFNLFSLTLCIMDNSIYAISTTYT